MHPPPVIAWLAARSVARGLPAPVPDHGGWRVDTNSEAETARWVFASMEPGLTALAQTIDMPRQLIKLCGTDADLRAALPDHWRLHPPAFFMEGPVLHAKLALPEGYDLDMARSGAALHARILTGDGDLAASGFAAETADAFVYDRIVTAPLHRRKGLGTAVILALGKAKRGAVPELLVATPQGRALYESLGWRVVSPYATASIPEGHAA